MATQTELFGDLRPAGRPRPHARQPPVDIEAPLWTIDKSRLIDEYIHHFLLVTKHGVYLDLFAGPQHVTDAENWSVRRVLERRTEGNPSIRHYAVCDIKRKQADRLRNLGRNHPSFRVYEGDANERVHEMLEGAPITAKTACFCLIDQRSFHCHWTTVEAVAQYKRASCEKRVRPSFCLRPRGERGSADGTQRSQDDSDRHCGRGAGAAGVHGACLPVMRASTREEMRRISSTSRSSSRLFSIHSR